jgi:hypothetical protein
MSTRVRGLPALGAALAAGESEMMIGLTQAQPLMLRAFDCNVNLEGSGGLGAGVDLGDLDGDGDLDIVLSAGRHFGGRSRIYFNAGDGSFPVARDLPSKLHPDGLYWGYGVQLADLDGDDDLDIAIGTDKGATKDIHFNDGQGNFTVGGTFGNPRMPTRNLALADMNEDGKIDIVVPNRGTQNFIFLNDGDGGFSESRPFGTGNDSTTTVAVGDLNGDGKPDLALANRDGQQSVVYLNDGRGGFDEARPFGPENGDTRAVAVGDLNGDGHVDLVASHALVGSFIYINDGQGNFPQSTTFAFPPDLTFSLAIADLNGDGFMDIVAGNHMFDAATSSAVYFNEGEGASFQEVRFGWVEGPGLVVDYAVAVGDLNADGFPDIVSARSSGQSGSVACLSSPESR